jgi:hypothetical protein
VTHAPIRSKAAPGLPRGRASQADGIPHGPHRARSVTPPPSVAAQPRENDPIKIRPCPGRQTSSRGRTQREQTSRSEQASHATTAGRLPGQEKSASRRCDLSQSSATSSHPIGPTSITTTSSNHRRYLIAPQPPALGSAPPRRTIGAACRNGSGSAGSRHAAQVRHRPSGARQPARA